MLVSGRVTSLRYLGIFDGQAAERQISQMRLGNDKIFALMMPDDLMLL